MKIVAFNKNQEWPFKKVKSNNTGRFARFHNDELYVSWLKKKLNELLGRPLAEGEKLNALCLSVNPVNNLYLVKYLSSGIFLNYSPMDDENLRENELGIRMSKIVTRDKEEVLDESA